MANNYFSPYGYNPYGANTAVGWYPQTQVYQQTTAPSFAWVQGIEAAKAYTVPAGTSMMLMDSEHPVIYVKSVDSTGKPQELEAAEKAVCLMEKIIMLREGGYSQNMRYPIHDGSFERGRSPRTDRYVSRDGRYYDPYSMGYSGHSIEDRAIDRLERMMDDASSEYERDCIKRYISLIRSEEK